MFPFFRLFKVEPRTAGDDVFLVLDVISQDFFQVENARFFVGKDKHNHTETDLHLGLFEKRVQNDLRVRVLFDVDYYAETVAVGLVLNVRDSFDTLVFDLVGDIFDKARLVDLIRKFGNDDSRPAVCHFFDFGAGADYAAAATGFVCLTNGRTAENDACRRKIGRGNEFHKVFDFQFGIFHKSDGGVDNFAEIVRWNGRRHTDGDTVRTVHEKVGVTRRKHDGLFTRVVEVRAEVHDAFVKVADHFVGDFGKPCFCVTISRRGVAVDRAEVAVSVDKRAADREVLSKPYESVVNRDVAVGVIFAENVADDKRALSERLVAGQIKFAHAVKDTAVYGFQTVPDVGNRTGYVDRHCVGDERFFHFLVKVDFDDFRHPEMFDEIFIFLRIVIFDYHFSSLLKCQVLLRASRCLR